MTQLNIALNLVTALGLGALIGMERQWRQRFAGLRTNALVALGASLFIVTMDSIRHPEDSARIAAQVVSGVGFLGAGVIMREGLSVRGLNTAATLWCAAGIGVLSGLGLYLQAVMGTCLVLVANVLLRLLAQRLKHVPCAQTEEDLRYQIRVSCREQDESHIRFLVLQSAGSGYLSLRSIHSTDLCDSAKVEVVAEIETQGRKDSMIEQVVSRLSMEKSVSSASWALAQREAAA
jgi:putative Mg2+ transporter-C (MgtC) family protein